MFTKNLIILEKNPYNSIFNSGPRAKVQYFIKFLKHLKAKLFYSHILLEIIINLTP